MVCFSILPKVKEGKKPGNYIRRIKRPVLTCSAEMNRIRKSSRGEGAVQLPPFRLETFYYIGQLTGDGRLNITCFSHADDGPAEQVTFIFFISLFNIALEGRLGLRRKITALREIIITVNKRSTTDSARVALCESLYKELSQNTVGTLIRRTYLLDDALVQAVEALEHGILTVLLVNYTVNTTVLATTNSRLNQVSTKLEQYSEDIAACSDIENEISSTKQRLSNVAGAINRHIQCTPLIQSTIEAMPEKIVLDKFKLYRAAYRRKVPDKNDPKKLVFVDVIERTILITACGMSQIGADEAIHKFIENLRESENLTTLIKDIKIVAKKDEEINGNVVPSYEIECLLNSEE